MATAQASAKINQTHSVWRNWRHVVVAGGLLVWIGSMALRTGAGAFVALWNVLLFLGALVVVTIPTRTVSVMELLGPFSLGGSMVGLSVLAGWALEMASGTRISHARALIIPLVEETVKIAPVLLILWRQRYRRAWTFGATDIILLAAASGSAFYWMEEAFIIHNRHSWSFVGSFPTTDIESNFVANHAIWTAISGLTIGVSNLLLGPGRRTMPIAASGWLWSTLDHAANNYNVHFRGAISNIFRAVTMNGRLSLYIFVAGICFALTLDLYFAYLARGERTPAQPMTFPVSRNQASPWFRYLHLRLQFAYASARYRAASGKTKERLAALVSSLGSSLRSGHW